jgi:drug/metabolite transporter (DMT)-like permease
MNPAAIAWDNPRALGASLMLLGASLAWAVCVLHLRYFRCPSSAYQLAPWQMLLAVPPLALAAWLSEGAPTADGSATFWLALLYVGPLATAFCYTAINAASTWMSPTAMSTAMLGVPVTGVVLSVAILGEPLTLGLATGSLAVLAGIAVNALPVSRGKRG